MIAGSNPRDRFRLDSLVRFQRGLRAETTLLDPQLAPLLRDSTIYQAGGEDPPVDPMLPLYVRFETPVCAVIARSLLDLDLELRRAAAYFVSERPRPAGGSAFIEITSVTRWYSVDVQLDLGSPIYAPLTSAPIAYLQILDWFWLHRQTRVRVRPPNEEIDPSYAWAAMIRTADDLVRRNLPSVVTIDIATDGTSVFGFAQRPSEVE